MAVTQSSESRILIGGVRRLFFVLLALPFLLVFPYVRSLNNPNELVRVYTVMAIVENGTYHIDEQVEELGHTDDMARVDGHYVMVKAPGVVHLGVPAYAVFSKVIAPLFGLHYPRPAELAALDEDTAERMRLRWTLATTWALRLACSQIPCLLFLIWFERFLRAYSKDAVLRCATVVAAGLGTNFLAYAHMFASHSLYAIAAFIAFAQLTRRAHPLRAGFLVSACVALEYQALFPALILSAFALWQYRRKSGWFVLGGALNVPLVMWFQKCAYGNAFTPGHKLLENPRFADEHRSGFWGISWPSLKALAGLTIDPGGGFFALSPFMWLGLLAVPIVMLRRPALRATTVAWFGAMLAALCVNAGFVEWRAGWTVGPRYLVVCAPFFAFGALTLLARIPAKAARGIAIGLALAGILSVGTVGILVDTLPDTIGRPFAQFFVPMLRRGLVAHTIADSAALWYIALAALVAAPLVLLRRSSLLAFLAAASVAMIPALTQPRDGTALFELHPSTWFYARDWEPAPLRERSADAR